MPPSENVTVRPAERDDLPAIVALLADDPLGATREDPGDLAVYRRAFDEVAAQAGNMLLVAERAGEIAGCLQFTIIPGLARRGTKRGQIEGVRVAAAARGLGLGERLVRHAIGLGRAAGCGLIQLTSDNSRADAHRFYRRLGFVASHAGFKLALD
ncbi:MAG TPA: GNAT family N-acetyltransferase [Stellaceae bacterium]|nr:GNAT family N-acetyltransferase [Stellaceae bacterium]